MRPAPLFVISCPNIETGTDVTDGGGGGMAVVLVCPIRVVERARARRGVGGSAGGRGHVLVAV